LDIGTVDELVGTDQKNVNVFTRAVDIILGVHPSDNLQSSYDFMKKEVNRHLVEIPSLV
jgi:hypothetical protein